MKSTPDGGGHQPRARGADRCDGGRDAAAHCSARNWLDALESVGREVAAAPFDAELHLRYAGVLLAIGREAEALEALARAHTLAAETDRDLARAATALPGPDYLAVLGQLHDWLRPAVYVEIGVAAGRSLALARHSVTVIGVDPRPRIEVPCPARTRLFPLTSDEFFAAAADDALEGRKIELAFVDGLHIFEQALVDVLNLERHGARDGVILVHDCLPLDEETQSRERRRAFWTGDVWKVVPALRVLRPDLAIATVAAPPTGLAVITQLDPTFGDQGARVQEVIARFIDHPLPTDAAELRAMLAVVPNDWPSLAARLDGAGVRPRRPTPEPEPHRTR